MSLLHRLLGFGIVAAFAILAIWGLVLRLLRRPEEPVLYRALLHWTENLLIVQIAVGVVLLLMGRRIVGVPLPVLHYFYGSLFPLITLVVGRIVRLRREDAGKPGYVAIAWAAFIAFGLTTRALMMGLQSLG